MSCPSIGWWLRRGKGEKRSGKNTKKGKQKRLDGDARGCLRHCTLMASLPRMSRQSRSAAAGLQGETPVLQVARPPRFFLAARLPSPALSALLSRLRCLLQVHAYAAPLFSQLFCLQPGFSQLSASSQPASVCSDSASVFVGSTVVGSPARVRGLSWPYPSHRTCTRTSVHMHRAAPSPAKHVRGRRTGRCVCSPAKPRRARLASWGAVWPAPPPPPTMRHDAWFCAAICLRKEASRGCGPNSCGSRGRFQRGSRPILQSTLVT